MNKKSLLLLNKGISLCKKGFLDDAEKIYINLLTNYPNNFDLNNLLGIIKLNKNEPARAIQLFNKAIIINPKEAKVFTHLAMAELALNNLDNAFISIKKAIKLNPNLVEAHNLLGLYYEKTGCEEDAKKSWQNALTIKPNYYDAKINLANFTLNIGEASKAIGLYEEILTDSPNHAVTLNNLASAYVKIEELDKAILLYKKSCTIDPNFYDAHHNIGTIFIKKKNYHDAILSFSTALKLNPLSAESNNKIGIAYQEIGDVSRAFDHYCKAIDLGSDNQNYYSNFAKLISGDFEKLRNKNLDKYISLLCRNKNCFAPIEISKYFELRIKNKNPDLTTFIHEVAIDDMTLAYLQMTPITEYSIEVMLIKSRQFLLQNIEKLIPNTNLLKFVNAMAVQCFINEFIWNETAVESQAVLSLEDNIFNRTQENKQIKALKLLLLSCYRPLDSYPASNQQFLIDSLNDYSDVVRIQIVEPSREFLIRENIPKLTEIISRVSTKVREQYESNPYPRWIATRLGRRDVDCNMLFDTVQLNLDQKPTQFSSKPNILIAGCGTGQHAITSATRFKNSVITAIDLSKSSLSYAIRKSRELDINNITFYQADILELINHHTKYDLIESCGVLHHMEDTFEAWNILAGLLKPDGLMKIALYSSTARKEIGEVRDIVRKKNLSGTLAEIRKMRYEICHSDESKFNSIRKISNIPDFFTVSECRDLLFHVQEKCFTLPEINVMVDKLGLVFLGFEFSDNKTKSMFSKYDPQASPYAFADWHNFEMAFPFAFSGMYQMWFKKH